MIPLFGDMRADAVRIRLNRRMYPNGQSPQIEVTSGTGKCSSWCEIVPCPEVPPPAVNLLHQERPSAPRTDSSYGDLYLDFQDGCLALRLYQRRCRPAMWQVPLPLFNRLVESLTYAA